MKILAIDPGPEKSAALIFDPDAGVPLDRWILPNADIRQRISVVAGLLGPYRLVIEMIASYGMPVGKDVFETCVEIGRFVQGAEPRTQVERIYRGEVKLHLCNSTRAKDSNIRAALIDKFGPGRSRAIGRKAAQGPLYGIKTHLWAALAVAVTAHEAPERCFR